MRRCWQVLSPSMSTSRGSTEGVRRRGGNSRSLTQLTNFASKSLRSAVHLWFRVWSGSSCALGFERCS